MKRDSPTRHNRGEWDSPSFILLYGAGGDDIDTRAEDVGDEDLAAAEGSLGPEPGYLGKDGEDHLPRHGAAQPDRDHFRRSVPNRD